MIKLNKKAQEEMIGFVVIIVIVSVILLVLLSFLLTSSNNEVIENYEIENFIQSTLQYTTSCEDYVEFLSIQKLIMACEEGTICLDKSDSCEVLNNTLSDILKESWNVGEQSAIKGYLLKIIVDEQEKITFKKGNETTNYKGGFQDFSRRGVDYIVSLNVYY